MKRLLSAIAAVMLLLGLGAIVVLALPDANTAPAAVVPVAVAAAPSGPEALAAPNAAFNWNAIAMALDARSTLPNAQALADAIPGAQQLLRWDASIQNFDYYIPGGGGGNNFNTTVGEPYLVLVDNTASNVFSMVGDVPPQSGQSGAVQFNLVGGSPCQWNYISVPLDKSNILDAQDLADAIGDVEQILVWDASIQNFDYYIPGGGGGNNFATQIGYPYWVCIGQSKVWPQ